VTEVCEKPTWYKSYHLNTLQCTNLPELMQNFSNTPLTHVCVLVQVTEEDLEQYISSQRLVGNKLPGITPPHSKAQVT